MLAALKLQVLLTKVKRNVITAVRSVKVKFHPFVKKERGEEKEKRNEKGREKQRRERGKRKGERKRRGMRRDREREEE